MKDLYKDLYVVTRGIYDNYCILAVCTSKEKAIEIVDTYNMLYTSFEGEEARIEKYEDGYCYQLKDIGYF